MFFPVIHTTLRFLKRQDGHPSPAFAGRTVAVATLAPGESASWPVTTTVSPDFTPLLDNSKIAVLALARRYRSKLDSIIGFHHKNERPTLADLHSLRRHKRSRP